MMLKLLLMVAFVSVIINGQPIPAGSEAEGLAIKPDEPQIAIPKSGAVPSNASAKVLESKLYIYLILLTMTHRGNN